MEGLGFDSAAHYCVHFFVFWFIAVKTVGKTGYVNLCLQPWLSHPHPTPGPTMSAQDSKTKIWHSPCGCAATAQAAVSVAQFLGGAMRHL